MDSAIASKPAPQGPRPITLWERAIAELKVSDVKSYVYLVGLLAREESLFCLVFEKAQTMYSCTTCSVLCKDCRHGPDHKGHAFEGLECQEIGTFCSCGVRNICCTHTSKQAPKSMRDQKALRVRSFMLSHGRGQASWTSQVARALSSTSLTMLLSILRPRATRLSI